MPAVETTHYRIKRLHAGMAVASLLLLGATVWAILSDHTRPWRGYQRAYRERVEPWRFEYSADDGAVLRRTDQGTPSGWARRLAGLPILDALGRPVEIEQVWLPELPVERHFAQAPRFDRCTTCHQGIDRAAPERPGEPAFPPTQTLALRLPTPRDRPGGAADGAPPSLEAVYGFALADEGVLDAAAPTVGRVLPRSKAADARLAPGDVILEIGGRKIESRNDVERFLLDEVASGGEVEMEVHRGLPHPHAGHPRLDLFVGPHSPHPKDRFGCTICHEGQGGATDFARAGHAPASPQQASRWRKEHGWFRDLHAERPMLPVPLAESRCLACHFAVTDLEPSERFADPPAPRLLEGYHLVRQLGCFGCHELSGFDAAGRRIGPDLRLEPAGGASFAARAAGQRPPGTMRKVGPSLRRVAAKMDAAYLADRIADPTGFLPETRMPQVLGLHDHLSGRELADAQRFEAVELRATVAWLLASSESPEPPDDPEVARRPSVGRGRALFELRGCLACHRHDDFPGGQATLGSDLSGAGLKYTAPDARAWLVAWLRDPARENPRTRMPNPLLDSVGRHPLLPDAEEDEQGDATSDPAEDIAAYLRASKGAAAGAEKPWTPPVLPPPLENDLDELTALELARLLSADEAERALRAGLSDEQIERLGTDAEALVGGQGAGAPPSIERKLLFVGRRSIARRGCAGCHDIPGFETEMPIGPELTGWGRKRAELLGFERIWEYAAKPHAASPREGFLRQKLREPRSFDYGVAADKSYTAWLTMGRFHLTEGEREAIVTFVLGLTGEPPPSAYLPQPDAARRAVVEGRKLLDEHACAECHVLGLERWTFEYDPREFPPPPPLVEFEFLEPQLPGERLAASRAVDLRGLARAELVGAPRVDFRGEPLEDEDDDGHPLGFFTLWEPAAIAGEAWPAGGADVPVALPQRVRRRPPWGGALGRLLYPTVVERARSAGAVAAQDEAWGWLPPPLAGFGRRVDPAWLHKYLLQPEPIRPLSLMRMPRYNLSADEARRLAEYFAAASGATFPYSEPPVAVSAADAAEVHARRDAAMRVLTDRTTFCAKCHATGEEDPRVGGLPTTLAPRLDRVAGRHRAEWLRRWLARPQETLPYTPMPVNFPPVGPPLGQDLLPGGSLEQIDAVVDLLLHYDEYLRRQMIVPSRTEPP